MTSKGKLNDMTGWLMTLLGVVGFFCFFQFAHPYHLQHREQTMLFLSNSDWIAEQYAATQRGWLARMAGDYLQQYFYYVGGGASILAVVLTLIAVMCYKLVRRLLPDKGWSIVTAYVLSIALTLWEGGRECLPEYPLASSLQVLGWMLLLWLVSLVRSRIVRCGALIVSLGVGFFLFDVGNMPNTKAWGLPNMQLEHQMALDVEASYGHWDKVEQLTEDDQPYNLDIYYRNLALAHRCALLEGLMERHQNGMDGIFMPVNEQGNYFLFAAAGEAWWAIGDLTMAEHATLLGMIFSPRHTGTRCLRRLTEINMAKGDDMAAMKYLRMLEQTVPHRSWAQAAMAQLKANAEGSDSRPFPTVTRQQQMQAATDTLRLSTQYHASLINLLDSNKDNLMAQQYLLAYDLMLKDMLDFADDVERCYAVPSCRVLEEARLIVMASREELRDAWNSHIQATTWEDFMAFNQAFTQNQGKAQALNARFGRTYWYYSQFAK